jgi:hypothetical protein
MREPVGTLLIYLSMLDDEDMSDEARRHLDVMLTSVTRMTEALAAMTKRFELELGDSTPLAIISHEDRRPHGR